MEFRGTGLISSCPHKSLLNDIAQSVHKKLKRKIVEEPGTSVFTLYLGPLLSHINWTMSLKVHRSALSFQQF